MSLIKRKKIKDSNEWIILSHMIMNKEIMSACYSRYKSGELKTKHFEKIYVYIFRWLIQYYSKYANAPKKTIRELFKRKTKGIDPAIKELISGYLERLSQEYENSQDETVNPDYIINEVIADFIREKEIKLRFKEAEESLEMGEYQEAENIILSYPKVNIEMIDENLGTIEPFTRNDVVAGSQNENENEIAFKFEGDLHRMIGSLCKSWLVAITGVEKSGKSFILQEIGYQAALFQKKKVLIINLELSKNLIRNRLWRRLTCSSQNKEITVSPVLDCDHNQKGICKVRQSLNSEPLFRNTSENVLYSKRPKWKICNQCRNKINSQFVPALWFEQNIIEKITEEKIKKSIRKNRLKNLSNLRVKCFPRYSVNFEDTYQYILRYTEKADWRPDIIIYDYLDILAPESKLEVRHDIDLKWKMASKLAGEFNSLVITADQATKASRSQYALDQMSTSESKTKDGHLDVRIALNKTDEEQDLEIARLSILFHRHAKFNIKKEILVTQRLTTSEPFRDNTFFYHRGKIHNVGI